MKPKYLIAFLLAAATASTRAQSPIPDTGKFFVKAEVMPDFPGGDKAWMAFLNKNLHYPMDAVSNEISGTVIVQFIVEPDSTLTNIQAISGPNGGGLREEAIRVIKESGKWAPALQNGHIVRCRTKRPIKFVLQY
ncbi:MAG TPA: energy transducer TonB [Puia sp.]|nr:energy transducer TonB [Puia sp.]